VLLDGGIVIRKDQPRFQGQPNGTPCEGEIKHDEIGVAAMAPGEMLADAHNGKRVLA
jgi:hypothetical protein